jgi:SAM-dependent methyltransferase
VAEQVTTPNGHEQRWRPLGQALLDFHRGRANDQIIVHTDLWNDEPTPVESFYRPDRHRLPELERIALKLCRGRTLDLGAGAGRHALELQRLGLAVTAVDISPEAVEVMRDRGVVDARCGDLECVRDESFETIVLLMHGIGLVGTLEGLATFLSRVGNHLSHDDGQVIFDSADLGLVMPEQFEDGLEDWRGGGLYPGEVEYRLSYGKLEGESYRWLFVDPVTLADKADAAGFRAEVVARGERGSYLARLRRRSSRV